jgi:hypothetical protein
MSGQLFGTGIVGIEGATKNYERIPTVKQQSAWLKRKMSNRGAGIDVLDRVSEEIDKQADYKSNVKDIARKYGFVGEEKIGKREAKERQCSAEISLCRGASIPSSCEFACEECKDKESCDELGELKESGGKSWEDRIRAEFKELPVVKSKKVSFAGKKKHRMRCPICGRAAPEDFCMVHGDVKSLDLTTSAKAQELTHGLMVARTGWLKKQRAKKAAVAAKKVAPSKHVGTPKPSKAREKVLTAKQIQEVRKRGYCDVTIQGVKKRITKRNVPLRKRTVQWYPSGKKIALKVMR